MTSPTMSKWHLGLRGRREYLSAVAFWLIAIVVLCGAPPGAAHAQFSSRKSPETGDRLATARIALDLRPVPRFTRNVCPFRIPAGMTIACGTLTVSEDRSQPNGAIIQLAVAIIPTRSPKPAP